MSVFTPAELEYLTSQKIGRLATVDSSGQPHVVPARFRYEPEHDTLAVGGGNMGTSKKFRDASEHNLIAYVIDDSPEPRKVRGVEVRGRAEIVRIGGDQLASGWDPEYIRLVPTHIASWGIDTDSSHPKGRTVSGTTDGGR